MCNPLKIGKLHILKKKCNLENIQTVEQLFLAQMHYFLFVFDVTFLL